MKYLRIVRPSFVLLLAASSALTAQAQITGQRETDKTDDPLATIARLKDSIDPIELHSLGRAYEAAGKEDDAGTAYELSFKGTYNAVDDALSRWTPNSTTSLSSMLTALNLKVVAGVASAEALLRLKKRVMRENEWRAKANTLFYLQKLRSTEEVFGWKGVDESVKFLSKPRPALTGTACDPRVRPGAVGTVTVILRIVFHADGKSLSVMPGPKWIKGCTESAMAAAEGIRFEPATKDGRPVATLRHMEYTFTVQ